MKNKTKQIAAWICILIIVSLIIATFVTALLDFPGSDVIFRSLLATTVLVPILIWIYMWLFKKVKEAKDDNNTHSPQ